MCAHSVKRVFVVSAKGFGWEGLEPSQGSGLSKLFSEIKVFVLCRLLKYLCTNLVTLCLYVHRGLVMVDQESTFAKLLPIFFRTIFKLLVFVFYSINITIIASLSNFPVGTLHFER